MSLLDTASLVITPNGTNASTLYSIVPSDGSGDMTVTRATTATRVNSAGLIESVASNVPRLDYSNGTCPSILVEPQRTNIILNSATLATQTQTVTAQQYTISFYGTGTVVLSGVHSATVVGLGITRKTYTFTPTAGSLIITVTGTCTNAQLEAGSYATSYIPTTSASVTRNADLISKTTVSSLIGQTEGVLFWDFQNVFSYGNDYFQVSDGSASNWMLVGIDGSGFIGYIVNGGAIQTYVTSAVTVGRNKIAMAYKNNDIVLYVNGSQVATDTSATIPATSRIDLSAANMGGVKTTTVKTYTAALWKTRLTNSQLAQLTTI